MPSARLKTGKYFIMQYNSLKKVLYTFVILLCSCQCDWNLYNQARMETRSEAYYWYYNDTLFDNIDSCQIIGFLSSLHDKESYSINRRCKIYHDTIYVEKRAIAGHHNRFEGILYFNKKEYPLQTTLE